MPGPQRVVLLASPTARLAEGIARFVGGFRAWDVSEADAGAETLAAFAADPPDGILTSYLAPAHEERLLRLGVPAVCLSAAAPRSRLPRVVQDDVAIGALAADHLAATPRACHAFVGQRGFGFSDLRRRGFAERLGGLGLGAVHEFPGRVLATGAGERWLHRREEGEVAAWIRGLPLPAAVFAANDRAALVVLRACAVAGRAVPEDVAVLGVDDLPACRLSTPTLSSIVLDLERQGLVAAALLDDLMAGRGGGDALVPPLGLAARESTDGLGGRDPEVAAFLRRIRAAAHRPVTIDELARGQGCSRRTLERRFRAALGVSPHDQLLAIRLDRAEELLRSAALPLRAVAARCGFASENGFAAAFRARHGTSPGAWRRAQGATGQRRLAGR